MMYPVWLVCVCVCVRRDACIPGDKVRQRQADFLAGGVQLRGALVARDGLVGGRAQVLGAQVGRVGGGHGAVGEDEADAAVCHRDVDGDEVGHGVVPGRGSATWAMCGGGGGECCAAGTLVVEALG